MDYDTYDKIAVINWETVCSYPVLGLAYQEADTAEMGILARVMASGFEVVSPDTDRDAVYKQYSNRARHALGENVS